MWEFASAKRLSAHFVWDKPAPCPLSHASSTLHPEPLILNLKRDKSEMDNAVRPYLT